MSEHNKNVKVTVGTIGKDGKTVRTPSDDAVKTHLNHFFSNDQDKSSDDQIEGKDTEMIKAIDRVAKLVAHAKKSFLEQGFTNDEALTLTRDLFSTGEKR